MLSQGVENISRLVAYIYRITFTIFLKYYFFKKPCFMTNLNGISFFKSNPIVSKIEDSNLRKISLTSGVTFFGILCL